MQIVGWTGGALVLGSVLMLLAWWAVVALVCRLGRQLLPHGCQQAPCCSGGCAARRGGGAGRAGKAQGVGPSSPGHGDAAG